MSAVQYVRVGEGAWPTLHPAALQGLAGDVVRTLGPETESDEAALLLSLLVAFGSAVGRGPYALVKSTRHHANLGVTLVGRTGEGRKGHSLDEIRSLMHAVDSTWAEKCVTNGGASSGEGLLFRVRDASSSTDRNGAAKTDAGVADKRLLVTEPEFAGVLRVCAREGNTLSAVLRSLYDKGSYDNLVKHNPVSTTNAHISILGHITPEELATELTKTDAANGFANRFLFALVRRSRFLPEGGCAVDVGPLVKRLSRALSDARKRGLVERDADAKRLWGDAYEDLVTPRPGMLGAVTGRGAPNVLRLSMVYALLDSSPTISTEHLQAALAVWDYAEQSARQVFGEALGDPVADSLLEFLRGRLPEPASRTEMSDWFSRNKTEAQISDALRKLSGLRLAERVEPEGDQGRGRPAELWRATSAFTSSKSFTSSGGGGGSPLSTDEGAPTNVTRYTKEIEEGSFPDDVLEELAASQDDHLEAILNGDPGTHQDPDDWGKHVERFEPEEAS